MTEAVELGPSVGVARYHREHERFYATNDLERAVRLRKVAAGLKTLGDYRDGLLRSELEAIPGRFSLQTPLSSLAAHGVMVDPARMGPTLKESLDLLDSEAKRMARVGSWLREKIIAGWDREQRLLTDRWAHLAPSRFRALANSAVNAERMAVGGLLLEMARAQLGDLIPLLTSEQAGSFDLGAQLRAVAWTVDAAALLAAEKATELVSAEFAWTQFLELAPQAEET